MNDNIQKWCLAEITESYDQCSEMTYTKDEFKTEYIIEKTTTIKEHFEEVLSMYIPDTKSPIFAAILNSIDYKEIYDDLVKYIEDNEEEDENEANIYPYKKCSVCSERKSCGNYDSNKIWFCEDCYEEDKE